MMLESEPLTPRELALQKNADRYMWSCVAWATFWLLTVVAFGWQLSRHGGACA